MQTVAIYLALSALIAWAWPRCSGILVPALAVNFMATALVGWIVTAAPDRDAFMIACDLALVFAVRFWATGWRRYFVGLIGMAAVMFRTSHMYGDGSGHWSFAAVLNMAFAAQVAIAGGAGDGVGRWLDDRIGRLWPRGLGLLRNVAGE